MPPRVVGRFRFNTGSNIPCCAIPLLILTACCSDSIEHRHEGYLIPPVRVDFIGGPRTISEAFCEPDGAVRQRFAYWHEGGVSMTRWQLVFGTNEDACAGFVLRRPIDLHNALTNGMFSVCLEHDPIVRQLSIGLGSGGAGGQTQWTDLPLERCLGPGRSSFEFHAIPLSDFAHANPAFDWTDIRELRVIRSGAGVETPGTATFHHVHANY